MASTFSKVFDVFTGSVKSHKDPNRELHTGDLVYIRNASLFVDSRSNNHDIINHKKMYIYSDSKMDNGRVAICENYVQCGKLPTITSITGWVERTDIEFID